MYYRKKRRQGKVIVFFSLMLIFIALTYGYVDNKNRPIVKPPHNSNENQVNGEKKNSIQANNEDTTNKGEDITKQAEETSQKDEPEENQENMFEVVSKDTEIIFNTLYRQTGEIIKKTTKVPITIAGMTLREFNNYILDNYSDWKIKSISTKSVALFREVDGITPNQYLIQNNEGYITIYKIDENGEKVLYQKTEISISIMSEVDKKKLDEGIFVKKLEDVMRIIEDYSS